jgi:hypothetical protein
LRAVTFALRILSALTFIVMCWYVYSALSGHWIWDDPYIFIVTIFQLLSMVVYFTASLIMAGLAAVVAGQDMAQVMVAIYNALALNTWYMHPYGVTGPVSDIFQVFVIFQSNLDQLLLILNVYTFTFLYFLFAALGVAFFLQSLIRMDHKFVGGAFLSIQAIMIVAAFRLVAIPNLAAFPTDIIQFFFSEAQILALISFTYLEVSYQMIYSHSVGKPVEEREDTLKKQLLALRQATRKQDAIERSERVGLTAMSRTSGATAFSFLREAIERKVIGGSNPLENLDAVADVRRLQIFVDELLSSDPDARNELTARAAAPSSSYVVISTITGTAFRFLGIIVIAFVFLNPAFFVSVLNLPPGIANSVEISQPEIVMFFLLPILLVFPLVAMVIGWLTNREVTEKVELAQEEKEAAAKRKKELDQKKRDAKKARKEREKARKKRKASAETEDEWDKALEDTFKR